MNAELEDQTTDVAFDLGEHDSLALFDGDAGTLPFQVRRALVSLLRRQVITRDRQPRDWGVLVAHEETMTSRLHDLFLDLIIDHDRGVAYKTQVHAEAAGDTPVLLRETSYTREETILLVFLRARRLSERSAGADRVYVDAEECLTAVESYRAPGMTDVVGEQQRARKAIASMRSAGILAATDETERFEITSVVEVVLSLQRVKELAATLGRINAPGASGVSMEAPGGDTDIKDDADRELVEGDSAE